MSRPSFHRLLAVLLPLLLCPGVRAGAQTACPSNINFELGSLSNWSFDTATNGGTNGIVSLGSTAAISGRHTLTNGTATDYYGGFPIVDPVGGNYSLKLGNDQIGGQVDRARYTITVPSNVNNYSLVYRYAVVLENPQHNSSEQPYFMVRVYNATTSALISCASFIYISSSSLPGFDTSIHKGNHRNGAIVYYKPWATATLNLSGQAGNTLVIEFTAADCSLGAHMGYGYVDLSCGLFAVSASSCNATSPLTAPPGFKTYTWYNANYSAIVDTGRSITVATPSAATQYHVVLTPYPGYGCADTLTTQVVGSTLAVNAGPDTSLCVHTSVPLNPVVTGNAPPFTYSWAPTAGLSCTNCRAPIASPAATTDYIISVSDTIGCTRRDTVRVKARPLIASAVTHPRCFGNATGTIIATASWGTAPYSYSWNTVPPQTTPGISGLGAGAYKLTLTDANGCIDTQTVTLRQPPLLVAAIASTDSVTCYGSATGRAVATAGGGSPGY